jgi:4-azaleucine resistance transporter AzlC
MRFLTEVWRGFRAGVPLWLGLVPFALAYAVMARQAGLAALDAQLMSVVVFAGGAQLSAVGLFAHGAGGLEIVATTLLLNLRHVLYGLSLSQRVPMGGAERLVAAHVLTDEAFGVAMSASEPSFAFFLGAGASVFVPWNIATGAGLWAGQLVDPARVSADFVFPLAFLGMLVLLVESRRDAVVAAVSGGLALVLTHILGAGLAMLSAVLVSTALGAVVGPRETAPAGGARP